MTLTIFLIKTGQTFLLLYFFRALYRVVCAFWKYPVSITFSVMVRHHFQTTFIFSFGCPFFLVSAIDRFARNIHTSEWNDEITTRNIGNDCTFTYLYYVTGVIILSMSKCGNRGNRNESDGGVSASYWPFQWVECKRNDIQRTLMWRHEKIPQRIPHWHFYLCISLFFLYLKNLQTSPV